MIERTDFRLVTPPEPEYDRFIRVAIINDLGLSEPEEEVQTIVDALETYLEAEVRLVVSGRGMHAVGLRDLDLLVLDYGGASLTGTAGLANWQVRAACEWAENHPGKLLLLWTAFTSWVYGDELQEEFGHLGNVMYRFSPKPSHRMEDGEAVFEKIKGWFWPNDGGESETL